MTTTFRLRRGDRLIAALIATAFCSNVWAAAASPGGPVSRDEPGVPSNEAAREQTAIKLAGLVAFVANSCPELKPDYSRFKAVIHGLGLDEHDLDKQETRNKYLSYTAVYQQNVKASCEKAVAQFGPKGTTLPDLFAVP